MSFNIYIILTYIPYDRRDLIMYQTEDCCEVYKVSDIQSILGIGKNKAYSLCTSGLFIYKRIGKSILIPKQSFLNWLNSVNQ